MKKTLNVLISFFAMAMATPILAEPTVSPTTKTIVSKGKRVASRKPASDGSLSLRATRRAPRESNWRWQIGVLGGLSTSDSSNAATQADRQSLGYNQNGLFGGMIDVTAYRYFGFEADGFYSASPSRSSQHFDPLLGKTVSDEKSLHTYAAQGALKGQLPFRWQSVQWSPKLGVGYGFLGMRNNLALANGAVDNETATAYGPYAMVGLDVDLMREVTISVDYSHSLGASGSINGATDTTSARYDRIRAGAYYRFNPSFSFGGQFQRRQLSFSSTGTSDTETFNQYLGVAAVTF
jgi:hypothetical protein